MPPEAHAGRGPLVHVVCSPKPSNCLSMTPDGIDWIKGCLTPAPVIAGYDVTTAVTDQAVHAAIAAPGRRVGIGSAASGCGFDGDPRCWTTKRTPTEPAHGLGGDGAGLSLVGFASAFIE